MRAQSLALNWMLISRDGSRNIDVEGSTRDNHTYNGVQKRKDYDGKNHIMEEWGTDKDCVLPSLRIPHCCSSISIVSLN